MRRLVGGLLVVTVVAVLVAPVAGAAGARAPSVADDGTVTAPLVGFDPLFSPWWLRHASRTTGTGTTTVLYLAVGATPETGRGFALARGPAVDGAASCGAPVAPLAVRTGPFRAADGVQSGTTVVVRRPAPRPGATQIVLVARDMTPAEIRAIAEQARASRGVVAPKTVPNGLLLRALAPVDTTLTTGTGTDYDVAGDPTGNRHVAVHAFTSRDASQDVVRFLRATTVGMACTPDRYVVSTTGDTTTTAVSTLPGDAARVAAMVRPVGRATFAKNVGWVRRPGVTQIARRCRGLGVVTTIAGQSHGQVWGVGFRVAKDAPVCVASRTGGADLPAGTDTQRGVAVSLHRTATCGLALVAGRAPTRTRRVVIRAGRARAQAGHLRTVRSRADRPPDVTVWAALVRTPPVAEPPVTVTALDARGTTLGTVQVTAGKHRSCRAGHPVPTTTTTSTTTTPPPS